MVTDGRDLAIVRAMTSLGRDLGLLVVAEGVETLAQAEMLADLRCDRAQGFLWSPAVPLGELLTLVQTAFPVRAESGRVPLPT
jgi:EAL domain-containing protein (putative c-di-GMP-specific phosphodiesterase class I)